MYEGYTVDTMIETYNNLDLPRNATKPAGIDRSLFSSEQVRPDGILNSGKYLLGDRARPTRQIVLSESHSFLSYKTTVDLRFPLKIFAEDHEPFAKKLKGEFRDERVLLEDATCKGV